MQLAFAGLVHGVSESCLVVQIAAMAYRGPIKSSLAYSLWLPEMVIEFL